MILLPRFKRGYLPFSASSRQFFVKDESDNSDKSIHEVYMTVDISPDRHECHVVGCLINTEYLEPIDIEKCATLDLKLVRFVDASDIKNYAVAISDFKEKTHIDTGEFLKRTIVNVIDINKTIIFDIYTVSSNLGGFRSYSGQERLLLKISEDSEFQSDDSTYQFIVSGISALGRISAHRESQSLEALLAFFKYGIKVKSKYVLKNPLSLKGDRISISDIGPNGIKYRIFQKSKLLPIELDLSPLDMPFLYNSNPI